MSSVYGEITARDPHGESVMTDIRTVFVAPGCGKRLCWVPKTQAGTYRMRGYKHVAFSEVEQLDGGQITPEGKEFGAYNMEKLDSGYAGFDDESGRNYLMWIYQREYDAVQRRALERMDMPLPEESALSEGLEIETDGLVVRGG